MASIPENKFSSVEVFDNGVKLSVKTGSNTSSNIYLRNEDVEKLVSTFVRTNKYIESNAEVPSESYEGIEDAIY